jgi:hypothetical protein
MESGGAKSIVRFRTLIVILIAFSMIPAAPLFMSQDATATPASQWLFPFPNRVFINISAGTGAGTDFQVKLLIGKTSGATGEDFDLGGGCLDNFNDIRFTANDGKTLLDYWIENVSASGTSYLATIWVEVQENLDTSRTIYCYYGAGSLAVSGSSGTHTFIYFEDFDYNMTQEIDARVGYNMLSG